MLKKHPILLITITLLCSVEFLQTGMMAFAATPSEAKSKPVPRSTVSSQPYMPAWLSF